MLVLDLSTPVICIVPFEIVGIDQFALYQVQKWC
jgi:hypothetical protein